MDNTSRFESGNAIPIAAYPAIDLCFDCSAPLPSTARFDVCAACIARQIDAERDRDCCANTLPERGYCRCGQHGSVR